MNTLPWIQLNEEGQLEELIRLSETKAVGIYKQSHRCSVCRFIVKSFSMQWQLPTDQFPVYYFDVVEKRALSNMIAAKFNITHQSPQFIVLRHGRAVYHASGGDIDYADILLHLN